MTSAKSVYSAGNQRHYISAMAYCSLFICVLLFPALAAGKPHNETQPRRYAIVVANNVSLDKGVAPLRFADDDGVRYYEMFVAAGVHTSLLTVLDEDTQKRYPGVSDVAMVPKKKQLDAVLKRVFARINSDVKSGRRVHFYFVYAGHGNVRQNQEGYLSLLDHALGRAELYREIVAKSPATFNHLILDACHAYFVVNSRGDKSDKDGNFRKQVLGFLEEETLAKYPNTGVILASSSESETHEWQQYEAGIFSHQIRSALFGGADVNNDKKLTYAETAAFVEAANAAVPVPKARLKVFYHPPSQQVDVPLLTLNDFTSAPTIILPANMASRYFVEDARWVRILDLNFTSEQPVSVQLVGTAPFYIREGTKEMVVNGDREVTTLDASNFVPVRSRNRGSIEKTFRKHLFEIPFGLGFYNGLLANLNRLDLSIDRLNPIRTGEYNFNDPTDSSQKEKGLRSWGWSAVGMGAALGISAGIVYGIAWKDHHDWKESEADADTTRFQENSDRKVSVARGLVVAGATLAILGSTLLLAERSRRRKKKSLYKNSSMFHRTEIEFAISPLGISSYF